MSTIIKLNKKDPGIETARLLGCLLVIGCHIQLAPWDGDHYDISRLYLSCLVADGVAVFWLIMGAFCFRSKSYARSLKKCFFHICLPLLAMLVCCWFLDGWFLNGLSLSESVRMRGTEDLKYWLHAVLTGNPVTPQTNHLWYLYLYMLIIFCLPVFRPFALWLDESGKRQKLFLLLSLLLFVYNDLTGGELAGFGFHSFGGLFPAMIEILWGHILYHKRRKILDHFRSRRLAVPAFAGLFLLINIPRVFIQIHNGTADQTRVHILYWYTSFGLLAASCIFMLGLALWRQSRTEFKTDGNSDLSAESASVAKKSAWRPSSAKIFSVKSYAERTSAAESSMDKEGFLKKISVSSVICFLGSCTYVIYLIHFPIVSHFMGLEMNLQSGLTAALGNTVAFEVLFYILMTAFIFLVSLAGAILIKGFLRLVSTAYRNLRHDTDH